MCPKRRTQLFSKSAHAEDGAAPAAEGCAHESPGPARGPARARSGAPSPLPAHPAVTIKDEPLQEERNVQCDEDGLRLSWTARQGAEGGDGARRAGCPGAERAAPRTRRSALSTREGGQTGRGTAGRPPAATCCLGSNGTVGSAFSPGHAELQLAQNTAEAALRNHKTWAEGAAGAAGAAGACVGARGPGSATSHAGRPHTDCAASGTSSVRRGPRRHKRTGDSGQCTVRGGVAAAGLPTPRRGLVPHGEAGSGAPRRHAHTLGRGRAVRGPRTRVYTAGRVGKRAPTARLAASTPSPCDGVSSAGAHAPACVMGPRSPHTHSEVFSRPSRSKRK